MDSSKDSYSNQHRSDNWSTKVSNVRGFSSSTSRHNPLETLEYVEIDIDPRRGSGELDIRVSKDLEALGK
ncbi:hypothetical protein SK128_020703 [Halocaridina rubra]|uniref:Uncharacterized protein n=1 Tax=Halocaridina rubra TaxID=373956 RepID=A0AAN9A6H3_HALRR